MPSLCARRGCGSGERRRRWQGGRRGKRGEGGEGGKQHGAEGAGGSVAIALTLLGAVLTAGGEFGGRPEAEAKLARSASSSATCSCGWSRRRRSSCTSPVKLSRSRAHKKSITRCACRQHNTPCTRERRRCTRSDQLVLWARGATHFVFSVPARLSEEPARQHLGRAIDNGRCAEAGRAERTRRSVGCVGHGRVGRRRDA